MLSSPLIHSAPLEGGASPRASTSESANLVENDLDTLEGVLSAFTQGLSPDLADESQKQVFDVYRCMKFGDPKYTVGDEMYEEVVRTVKKYPDLKKTFFRNYRIIVKEQSA